MPVDGDNMGGTALNSDSIAEVGRRVFEIEIAALQRVRSKLDKAFVRAVRIVLESHGKVVLIGVGKSGLVAQKIAASCRSTGTPAVFIDGSGAMHGDLGVYAPGDPTILISKSGATSELLRMLPRLRQLGSPTIAIVGNLRSPLAEGVNVVLDAEVAKEADPLDLVPTSSATCALVLGHALVAALMEARGFTREEFTANHPAGLLGRSLSLRVGDVMHTGSRVAQVSARTSIKDVIVELSAKKLGAVCVVDGDGMLCGVVTDGDVRRMLQSYDDVRPLTAGSVMTETPVTVGPGGLLGEALKVMEDRSSQISVLPVVDDDGRLLGLLRLHDILRADGI